MGMNTQPFKTALETERARVHQQLTELGVQNPFVANDWVGTPEDGITAEPDPNVAADQVEDWGAREGEVSALEVRYHNIIRALKKIDTNTYGTCEICGGTIETDRLTANPAARTCKAHLDSEAELTA